MGRDLYVFPVSFCGSLTEMPMHHAVMTHSLAHIYNHIFMVHILNSRGYLKETMGLCLNSFNETTFSELP